MASDPGKRPSPSEARQALTSISESKKALAPHVRSPKWLYPVQGVGTGLFIIGLVFARDHGWGQGVLAAAAIIFCLLPLLQSRGRVVMDVYTHRGSRGLGLAYAGLLAAITLAAVVFYALSASAWAVAGAAVLSLMLTLIMGPAMDARLERAVRTGH